MKESILSKIEDLVVKGIESEAEAVYLLSQMRKFIEQQELDGYYSLNMCTNWCLHSQLDNGNVQRFLSKINDFVNAWSLDCNTTINNIPDLFEKMSFVHSLREDIRTFLQDFGMDLSFCEDELRYQQFLRFFERVIEDTPLIYKTREQLYALTEVKFSKSREFIISEETTPFCWTVLNGDQVILEIRI